MIDGGASGGSGSFIGLCGTNGLMSGGRGSFGVTSGGSDGGSGMCGLGAGIVIGVLQFVLLNRLYSTKGESCADSRRTARHLLRPLVQRLGLTRTAPSATAPSVQTCRLVALSFAGEDHAINPSALVIRDVERAIRTFRDTDRTVLGRRRQRPGRSGETVGEGLGGA
jgi:hypothetical protein